MFASKTTKDLQFGEDTVKIRKLSGNQIDQAHEIKSREQIKNLREMGGELLTALRAAPAEIEKAQANIEAKKANKRQTRIDALDRSSVLASGITVINGSTAFDLADIEEMVSQSIFEAVVDLTYGSEAEQGKD